MSKNGVRFAAAISGLVLSMIGPVFAQDPSIVDDDLSSQEVRVAAKRTKVDTFVLVKL